MKDVVIEETRFRRANLSGVFMFRGVMERANFRGATLISSKFIGASLRGADFSHVRFQNTFFLGAVHVPDSVKKKISSNWRAN
ncbi:MAG: pentapeptide repeat-containing protein [bacterium]|nr:pentapeptide repeat-containing protein [bacterium]